MQNAQGEIRKQCARGHLSKKKLKPKRQNAGCASGSSSWVGGERARIAKSHDACKGSTKIRKHSKDQSLLPTYIQGCRHIEGSLESGSAKNLASLRIR
jgi:hypothetical protein